MQPLRAIDKILILAVVLIGLGQLYLITHSARVTPSLQPTGITSSSATTPPAPKVYSPPPSNILTPIAGTVASIESNAIVVSGAAGTTQHIAITSATVILTQGGRKDQKTIDAEMEAFRQSSNKLAADPTNNHDALATLIAPSPYVETPISLSAVKPGDSVTVFVEQSPSSPTAVRITLVPAQHI
jgi:hypothetical protein